MAPGTQQNTVVTEEEEVDDKHASELFRQNQQNAEFFKKCQAYVTNPSLCHKDDVVDPMIQHYFNCHDSRLAPNSRSLQVFKNGTLMINNQFMSLEECQSIAKVMIKASDV